MLVLRLCGGVAVEVDGRVLPEPLIGGRQGRLVLAYLVCERNRPVRREELAQLLWADQLPDSWTASLSAVISRLRRLFAEAGFDGSTVVVSTPGAYQLALPEGSRVDVEDLVAAVAKAEQAAAEGEADRALVAAANAEAVAAHGFLLDDCEWVDGYRDAIRDLYVRALIAASAAHLGARRPARAIEAARRAVALDATKEAVYRQLMVALTAAGERAEALRVWEQCRITLVEELGVDPSPETEAVYLEILDASPPIAPPAPTALPSGVVTFLLTDIVESSALWEEHPEGMAAALERHDAIVAFVVEGHGGTLLKSKLEGDATVSVFARATECAAAALALVDAIESEPWPESARPRVRLALHTGEAFERGGDYFGPALNRAARVRSLAAAGEVLLSQAVAELVRDHLPGGVVLRDRGRRSLRGLSRDENVFELTRPSVQVAESGSAPATSDELARPPIPVALTGTGPFVGRGAELEQLAELWRRATASEAGAVFVGGEPGVGKSRLAGEIARRAHADGGLVLYGRCDEDLAAPLQPFIEAIRVLAPALGAERLCAVRGIDELTRVVPELADLLGDKPGIRADPDTERLALFDAVTQLLVATSHEVPVLFVLDDLHWAGKTTLSLLRHLLRGSRGDRLLIVGTYRDTELARSHPLAGTLADLRGETVTHRITLGGLGEADVSAYLQAIGNTDRALERELAKITAGNPFFLIEVIRHVQESGGSWQPGSLPEGVREATGRRLSRLSEAANDALAVAAVAGTTFDLALVEQVCGAELIDPIADAVQAGLVIEEPGSLARFRFAHAIVRQVLLSELVSLKRVRLHRAIAELLDAAQPTADPDARLADLAYHWFECASAGSSDKAVAACRRAADRALERLAYEEAGDLYGMALQALEWVDGDTGETAAALHLARCDALLTAGDVVAASAAIDALEVAAAGSERLAAWYTTYEGLLAVLGEPDRLTEIVQSIGAAASAMRDAGDLTGEAKARYVHASALERLGQIGAAERALDAALAAARSAGDRRLADAILSEAPPAHLWGPSPVTRASGRCLDVVRVLRITSGTAAVEAVALRCQAVLEALRGRMDAARRLIASAHRTVDQLGLTHRRLEAEVAAGLIELLDGEAVAAEGLLRPAYEGLRERGLGGEAAQAGAFLGRALLLQGRVDEGDEVAAAAEALAGSDLKAAITWRDVRAEAAARRGDTDRALALAHEAVELASATDALLLAADARLTLAVVLRAAGDDDAAASAARVAIEASEAKGATVLAALARQTIGIPPDAAREGPPVDAAVDERPMTNLATATMIRRQEAFNRGDWDALRASRTDSWRNDDRRPLVGLTTFGDDVTESGRFALAGGGQLDQPELLATRGEHVALARTVFRAPGMEVPFLAIIRVEPDGRAAEYLMFEPEAIDEAAAALDAMAAASAFENDATRTAARYEAAFNARDWDASVACYANNYTIEERRSLIRVSLDGAKLIESMRLVFDGGGQIETEVLGTRGRSLSLARVTLWVRSPEATATVLCVSSFDGEGRYERTVTFDPEDLDAAYAELDRMFRDGEGAVHAEALALGASCLDAFACLDDAAFGALLAPGFEVRDHRALAVWSLGGRIEHIADLSSSGGLWSVVGVGQLSDGGQFEIALLLALHIADGRLTSLDIYDKNDVDAARATLQRPTSLESEWSENDATRSMARYCAAHNAHDWTAVVENFADDMTSDDRRSLVKVFSDHDKSMASIRLVFDGRGELQYEVLATRGPSLCLSRWTLWLPELEAGDTVLTLVEVDETGRGKRQIMFDPDDLDGALAELERLYREREDTNAAWRAAVAHRNAMNDKDLPAYVDATDPAFVYVDNRHGYGLRFEGEDAFDAFLVWFDIDDVRLDRALLATRGDTLALTRDRVWFVDGNAGQSEVEAIGLFECGPSGTVLAHTLFDGDDVAAAYVALDARFAELNADQGNAAWRAVQRLRDAAARRDIQAFSDALHPDFISVDRRSGALLRLEGDEALDTYRILLSLDEFAWESILVATRGDRLVLTRDTVTFVDGHAGPAEVSYLQVAQVDEQGLWVESEAFDIDDLDAAHAALGSRHDALLTSVEAADGLTWFENDAWRTLLRLRDAAHRRDIQGIRRAIHPEAVSIDHCNAGLRLEGDAFFEVFPFMLALDEFTWESTLVATRGDRLMLTRDTVTFVDGRAGPADVVRLNVVEVDERGRQIWVETFLPDDLDAAYDALDDRWVALGATPFGPVLKRSVAARDWDAFASVLAPNCTVIDHRTTGWGTVDRDTAVGYQRSLAEVAPDAHWWVDHVRRQGNVYLGASRVVGAETGGAWEIAFITVGVTQPNGPAQHVEAYDVRDLPIAIERFDQLVADPSAQRQRNQRPQ